MSALVIEFACSTGVWSWLLERRESISAWVMMVSLLACSAMMELNSSRTVSRTELAL